VEKLVNRLAFFCGDDQQQKAVLEPRKAQGFAGLADHAERLRGHQAASSNFD
jgi:hypothetical protein